MSATLHGLFVGASILLVIGLFVGGVYAQFKAAANRKPGVSFMAAANSMNQLFRDSLYTNEGLKWCVTSWRCIIGFAFTAGVLGIVERIIANSP